MDQQREHRIHQLFEVSVLLKGAHALLECAAGAALALVSTEQITGLLTGLTQDELAQDPRDLVANSLLGWARGFSIESKNFFVLYLLGHGIIKLALVVALLRNKAWAYPASLVVLGGFIAYQLYRYSFTYSVGLLLLTAFDLLVMVLIWHEYRLVRRHIQLP